MGNNKPLVAADDHFRVVDENSMVLYHAGEHVPAVHTGLDTVPAELVDGVYVPAEPAAPKRRTPRARA